MMAESFYWDGEDANPESWVPLAEDTDARRWARKFMETVRATGGLGSVDEELMRSWFSCAIEAGQWAGKRSAAAAPDLTLTERLDVLEQMLFNLVDRVARLEAGRSVPMCMSLQDDPESWDLSRTSGLVDFEPESYSTKDFEAWVRSMPGRGEKP